MQAQVSAGVNSFVLQIGYNISQRLLRGSINLPLSVCSR